MMMTRAFTGGRIRKAQYDPASQQLEVHFDNRQVLAYKQVPEEVFRRLCAAPNPSTYWEDRIADEYPRFAVPGGDGTAENPRDLFGDPS
jgi:hypothetical protein